MGSITWDQDIATAYDAIYAAKFDEAALRPMLDLLAQLAGDGPALEFAVGTGRVALPLSKRGFPVSAIELSPHMADRLRAKPGADAVPVTIGSMTTTRVPGTFALVYLVANTIMNVTTQDEQVSVFANAAAHLHPGGCFVVEVIVPQLQGSLGVRWAGYSLWRLITSASRRSTIWSAKSPGPITGWRCKVASSDTPPRTGSCGLRNST